MNQDNEPIEEGQPIEPLANLEQDVSPQFLGAVRKKIYRRTAANQVVAFSWNLPKVIFLEMILLIAHFFTSSNTSNPSTGKAKP
jgi:hypothetical protein